MARSQSKFSSPRTRPSKVQKSYPQIFVKGQRQALAQDKQRQRSGKTGQFGVV